MLPNDYRNNMNHRSSFSSARTTSTSTTLTSAHILDQNQAEIFDGATSQTVPSSMLSFHHPHSFQSNSAFGTYNQQSGNNNESIRGRRTTEADNLLDDADNRSSFNYSQENRLHNENYSKTPSKSREQISNFKFFSEEQVGNAEGSSTLQNLDYNIEWDMVPVYEQNVIRNSRLNSRRSSFQRSHMHSRRGSAESSTSDIVHNQGNYGSFVENQLHNKLDNISGGAHKNHLLDTEQTRAYEAGLSTREQEVPQMYHAFTNSSSDTSKYTTRDRIPYELQNESEEGLDNRSSSNSIGIPSDSSLLSDNDFENANQVEESGYSDYQNKKQNLQHAEYLKPQYHEKFYSDYPPINKFQRFYIAEEDLVIGIAGYKTSKPFYLLYIALCWLTFGMTYLLMRWIPSYKVSFFGIPTELAKSEWVVVESELGDLSIIEIQRAWYNRLLTTILHVPQEVYYDTVGEATDDFNFYHACKANPNIPILISFNYRYISFIYSPVNDFFKTNNNWTDPKWLEIDHIKKGLSNATQEDRIIAFGKNQINLSMKSTIQILFDETLHPFYVFQIFSILLWSIDEYYYYAFCIFLISLISIIDSLMETKKTSRRLAELSAFNCDVRVLRGGFWTNVKSFELVPGDIFEISDPSLALCPCDAILLSGNCIINESMLTGESVPVSKVQATKETIIQLLNDMINSQISNFVSKSFLFNGTKIIRAKVTPGENAALAMVVRTGFSTVKGSLVRSMVFPRPIGFKFYTDSFKYIGFMTIIALFGFLISCIQFLRINLDKKTMILRALDIITIVVPPALPATLTIGISFALSRLKKNGIFCISPTRVNVAGKLDVMCFDKTGTLTEDQLDVLGVHISLPSETENMLSPLIENGYDIFTNFSLKDCNSPSDSRSRDFLISLLTCHSLRHADGELIGDPLDYKMFKFTGWLFEEDFKNKTFHSSYEERYEGELFPENTGIIPAVVYPNSKDPKNKFIEHDSNNFIGILRSFEFMPELRRMSVIVKPSNENLYWSFTKGAPEVILELCNKNTIPSNFDEILYHYTHNGFRVIACAGKMLPKRTWLYSQRVARETVESNLEFLGFVIFENKLKPASQPTLATLQDANIRTLMCTGDNILTAVCMGRESGLVQTSRIYVPSLCTTDYDGGQIIVWNDIDNPEHELDVNTLKPLDDCKDYSLGVSGEVFRIVFRNENNIMIIDEEYKNEILLKASIYARMSPDEKHELMEQLQKLDYCVGFCGDGANDCGALKAADVGISLSEAEASVAAPFTSQVFDISCVLDIIKEGRASLVTSFSCFQYMSLYSAIQFITITILYSRGSNLGDFQFLYIDLFLIVPLAIFMSWSKPYDRLDKKRPSANLVSPKILWPLVISITISLFFQLIPWIYVKNQPWYIKPTIGGDDVVQSSDNTVLFFVSNFQYVIAALVLSVGPPYREPMSKNIGFILDASVSIWISVVLMMINTDSYLGKLLQLTKISSKFKILILLLVTANYFVQLYLPNYVKQIFKKKQSNKKYKNILRSQQCVETV
ncbi:hypothetical protein TPHA_0J01550 [Tetrapisispora phaffii CBS 4417]|uniref:Cation-transporting ATPase n=1 Tax=Tetrapisispora phaffii (strain ATCC 24235 / CBS 4417 / NBRC 1672 / NRRL Y-8282 / UCD 70-5) TaxID=1071381 RepID=G8BYN4_TETPH|nr:hypothetical protein TPHA_0J01550 [Tetrapisispora phaffii CBS 4417]CCE64976.1 hypothetical protein TPHA_0J01550 [Tetrapisispora phaffii CBS 4417]